MFRTFILSLLFIALTFLSVQAQFSQTYYTDQFYEIFVSSKGEIASIHADLDFRNVLRTKFLKFNSNGEITDRIDVTGVPTQLPYYCVTKDDEIIFSTPEGIKIYNFDGELVRNIGYSTVGYIFKDNEDNFLIANPQEFDCNFIKLDNSGNVVWNKFLENCKQIRSVDTEDGYVVALHKINEAKTDPIQFIKYDKDGNVVATKEYNINADFTGFHYTSNGLFATTFNLLIALDNNLDTLWTKSITPTIPTRWIQSKANANGIYILYDSYNPAPEPNLIQKLVKYDFKGNVLNEYIKGSTFAEEVRSYTVTETDDVFIVFRAASPSKTLLLKGDIVTGTTSLSEISFKMYPNPVAENSALIINTPISDATLTIFDVKGNKLREGIKLSDNISVDHSLKSGMYFYQVLKDSSVLTSGKIIVE
ncbi:MAG: T9SS type A sorting domain-containing protein [Sporocytophaga sp.]|uniref:T9SS type A sorting domain-containing protein n=1 Tax=Sporocytophaga sp. TaxID=2231183 RepID=UPI001B239A54|nr:T9SS type A sorting domain-containing protein [Sporocytophaga sp.]MBO9699826.1 T9SS type A sorting domain-containing protein [Sporocytophaga sp.]